MMMIAKLGWAEVVKNMGVAVVGWGGDVISDLCGSGGSGSDGDGRGDGVVVEVGLVVLVVVVVVVKLWKWL